MQYHNASLRMPSCAILIGLVCNLSGVLGCAAAGEEATTTPIPPTTPQTDSDPDKQLEAQRDYFRDFYARMADAENGNFKISGKVVDEIGQELTEVHVRVMKRQSSTGHWGKYGEDAKRTKRESMMINSDFDFHFRGYQEIRLLFWKEGYYSEEIILTNNNKWNRETLDMLRAGGVVKPDEINPGRLRIVLEKHGNLTQLQHIRGPLVETSDGQRTTMDLAVKSQRAHEQPATASTTLPSTTLTMSVARDEQGQFSLMTVQKSGIFEFYAPTSATLTMSAPEDSDSGFILYKPKVWQRAYREMKEAPETGYQREIKFSEELCRALYTNDTENSDLYFFIKSGSFYGKGGVAGFTVSKDKKTVKMNIGVLLQPDGSRNLEQERY